MTPEAGRCWVSHTPGGLYSLSAYRAPVLCLQRRLPLLGIDHTLPRFRTSPNLAISFSSSATPSLDVSHDQGSSGLTPPCNPVLHTALLTVKPGLRVDACDASIASMRSETSMISSNVPTETLQVTQNAMTGISQDTPDKIPVVKQDSTGFVQSVIQYVSNFRIWWESIHELYRQDLSLWGFGTNPIFVVYEGAGGKIERVEIDESEIERRAAVKKSLDNVDDTHERLVCAKAIAENIKAGNQVPPRHSTVFTIVKTYESQNIAGQIFHQINTMAYTAAPVIKSAILIVLPLYGMCVLWSAFQITVLGNKNDKIQDDKQLRDLQKLKAKMGRGKDTLECEMMSNNQSSNESTDFLVRLKEVREIAQKARATTASIGSMVPQTLPEQNLSRNLQSLTEIPVQNEETRTQLSACDSMPEISIHSKVDTRELHSIDSNFTDTNIQANMYTEKDKPAVANSFIASQTNKELHTKSPPVAQASEDVAVNDSHSDMISTNESSRVQPCIIMSLEEAKAMIASKKGKIQGASSHYSQPLMGTGNAVDKNAATDNADSEEGEHAPAAASLNGVSDNHVLASSAQMVGGGVVETGGQLTRNVSTSRGVGSHGGGWNDPNKMMRSYLIEKSAGNERPLYRGDNGVHSAASDESHVKDFSSGEALEISKRMDPQNGLDGTSHPGQGSSNTFEERDVVGSGQPLRKREIFSKTKRWGSALQKKYDREADPEMRKLMEEIGSGLDTWVTEAEIENTARLAEELMAQDDEKQASKYWKVTQKIKTQKEKFGLDAVVNKYKEYQPDLRDELWWLDLRYVLCVLAMSKQQDEQGLYSLDMSLDAGRADNKEVKHIVAFEERSDAVNFCYLLSHKSERVGHAEVVPFFPKHLYKLAKQEEFKVTVLRKGQLQLHIEQTVDEVEEKILEIGRSIYLDKLERERTLDMDSILHQGFGL